MRTILIRLMTNSYERAMYSLICNMTGTAEPFGAVEIRSDHLLASFRIFYRFVLEIFLY